MKKLILVIILITISACSANYSPIAYENAIKAKNDVLTTVELSVNPYPDHSAKVDSLKLQLNEYYLFELERDHNKATVEMWKRIITDKGVVTKYLELWRKQSKISVFTKDAKKLQLEELFNDLIELEKAKQ